jgi:hypothetical protein
MAQATRLFLTLAKQEMSPAEICTRMNDAHRNGAEPSDDLTMMCLYIAQ